MVADIKSERWPASNRNRWPDCVGIRISPTQYGERIKAAAIYLNVQQLIPEDRVAQR
jgi:hypothetical protein